MSEEDLRSLLLSWRTTDVSPNISRIMELPRAGFDTLPNTSSSWRRRLSTNKAVDSCLKLSELSLHESRLSEAGAQEGSVDCDQDPGALGEGDCRQEETAPEENLEDSNETHGRVIVFLDELPDCLSERVGLKIRLGRWGCARYWCLGYGWLNGGNEVCTGIGCNVEDRVDAKGKHGERILR